MLTINVNPQVNQLQPNELASHYLILLFIHHRNSIALRIPSIAFHLSLHTFHLAHRPDVET